MDRAPRKSYYVKKADRLKAEEQERQREFAFAKPVDGQSYLKQGAAADAARAALHAKVHDPLAISAEEEAFLRRTGVISGYTEEQVAAMNKDREARASAAITAFTNLDDDQRHEFLMSFHPGALLDALRRHGGTLQACAEAQLLVLKKSADYNNTGSNKGAASTFKASRDDYFPFGLKSYAQMIHTKSQRLISLSNKDGSSNFESARDTMLDLINYASFGADWLHRDELSRQMVGETKDAAPC